VTGFRRLGIRKELDTRFKTRSVTPTPQSPRRQSPAPCRCAGLEIDFTPSRVSPRLAGHLSVSTQAVQNCRGSPGVSDDTQARTLSRLKSICDRRRALTSVRGRVGEPITFGCHLILIGGILYNAAMGIVYTTRGTRQERGVGDNRHPNRGIHRNRCGLPRRFLIPLK
jgi:hypothetical protein